MGCVKRPKEKLKMKDSFVTKVEVKKPAVSNPVEAVVSCDFDHVWEGEYEEITDLDRHLLKSAVKGNIRTGFMVEAVAMKTIRNKSN
jgi:hypothetical protein